MEKLTIFYLENCPYCRNAQKAAEELVRENADYAGLEIDWVEESREPDLAEQYDYYYVPSVFRGKDKLYECSPAHDYEAVRENLKKAFDSAL